MRSALSSTPTNVNALYFNFALRIFYFISSCFDETFLEIAKPPPMRFATIPVFYSDAPLIRDF